MTQSVDNNLETKQKTGSEDQEKSKLKPCCACPITRKARDMCIVERGEEECTELIKAHRDCMIKLGFNI